MEKIVLIIALPSICFSAGLSYANRVVNENHTQYNYQDEELSHRPVTIGFHISAGYSFW